jgi:hypothetical protein
LSGWGDQEGFLNGALYKVAFLKFWTYFRTCFTYQSQLSSSILISSLNPGRRKYKICLVSQWTKLDVMTVSPEKVHISDGDD